MYGRSAHPAAAAGRSHRASVVFVGLAVVLPLPSVAHAADLPASAGSLLETAVRDDAAGRPTDEVGGDGLLRRWVAEAARQLASVDAAVVPVPVALVAADRPADGPPTSAEGPLPTDPSIPGRVDLPPPLA